MLRLQACPSCAVQIPEDGAFCDACGHPLAGCASCGALGKLGERCVQHGATLSPRPSSAPGAAAPPVAPVSKPLVPPPPRRSPSPDKAAGPPPGAAAPASGAVVVPEPPMGRSPSASAPANASQATSFFTLVPKLRLVVTSGEPLPFIELAPETIVGRGEGPFAMLLDPYHARGVSRRHCLFRRDPTGAWSVTDLAGRGSTWVSPDGKFVSPPLAPNESRPIEPGRDHLQLGQLRFRIEGVS